MNASWKKTPVNLHTDPRIWGLSSDAFRLVACIIFAPPGAPITPEYALWVSRVGKQSLDEAVAAGVMSISADGLVVLADFLVVQDNPSTIRSRRHRERQKAAQATAEQSSAVESSPVVEHHPEQKPATVEQDLTVEAQPDLIFPPEVTPAERASMLAALATLPHHQAQTVLDELAGGILDGKTVRNRVGWVRAIAAKARDGLFAPEHGIKVAEGRRRAEMITQSVAISAPAVPFEQSIAGIKDKGFAAILTRIRRNHFMSTA
ncbi:MAG: hypothetical protein HQL97_01000 [Magnetococcales bacterium]|nr:hypothetical protein [Magnetococcales bacterium]